MKFIIAVVMLAVASVSLAAAVGPVLEVSHWGAHSPGPVVESHWGGGWGGDVSGAWDGSWGGSSGSPHGAPHISLHQGHGGHGPVVDHGHGHGHDGKYVAANRGSVHVAPLVGHIQSVSSKNLEPAPGTTW